MLNNYEQVELVWSEGDDPKIIGVTIGDYRLSSLDYIEYFQNRQRLFNIWSQIFKLIEEIRKNHCYGY